jgi:ATP-binding cassette subfamily B protein
LTIVISAILLFSQNVKLAFLCLVPIPLYFLYMSFSAKKIKTTVDTISNYGDKLTGRVIEDLSIFGITFSRLNSTYRVQEGELSVIADLIKGTKVRLNLLYRSNQIFNVFTTSIGISLLYFYGGLLMLDEEVTVGTIVLFTVLAYKIYQPLSFLSFNMVEISTCISSLQRIDRIFSISPDNRFAIASGSANASKELLNDQFAIEFNNVSFSFSESSNKHCLNKISIAIEKGKKVAIVGGNGAGKSTLAMLIAGLYNSTSGDVRLFGNKVSDLSFSDLSKIVGVAFSSNFFFDGTILENLKIVRQNASDNEIDDSLRKSLCSGFLNEITNGVHSKIQSDGHNLSSGQKQRLALARLLLKQTPIFILDEVTANIDAESESDIFNSIKMLPDDVTVLVISHNVNVIKNFDLILFMHDGDLISSGSFKELSSNCAGFRELFNLNSLVNYKSEVA